jgi:peptidoglycan/LPS O-acetylase OafA/YrhL
VFRVGFMLTHRSPLLEAFWFVIAIAASIVAGYLSYRLIEKPSVAWSHRVRMLKFPSKPAAIVPVPSDVGTN